MKKLRRKREEMSEKLIDLSDLDIGTKIEEEEWPTSQLKNIIHDLLPEKYGINSKLNESVIPYPNDSSPSKSEIASEFRPHILLQGLNLKREWNSRSWGGMVYRILMQKNSVKKEEKAVIQYLYIWTRQKLFFTFWLDVVPLWILFLFSVYINTDVISYNPTFGSSTSTPLELGFLELSDRIIMILVIALGLIALAVITTLLRRKFYIHSTLHFTYALVFMSQIIELSNSISPPITFDWTLSVPFLVNDSQLITNIPYIPFFMIILSVIFLLLLKFQIPIFKIGGQHKMDYAPVFVYIKKENGGTWKLERILYDNVHYFTSQKSFEKSNNIELLTQNGYSRPRLVINTSWHSMMSSRVFWALSKNKLLTKLMPYTFWIGVFLLVFTTIFPDFLIELMGSTIPAEHITTIQLILRIFLLLLVILPLVFVALWEPTDLDDKENLAKQNYHLTDAKLLALWNLEDKPKKIKGLRVFSPKLSEAQFKIIEKLQDPFNLTDDNFWETFYNMEFQKNNIEVKLLRAVNSILRFQK